VLVTGQADSFRQVRCTRRTTALVRCSNAHVPTCQVRAGETVEELCAASLPVVREQLARTAAAASGSGSSSHSVWAQEERVARAALAALDGIVDREQELLRRLERCVLPLDGRLLRQVRGRALTAGRWVVRGGG
jgi:hypothetical protein